MGEKPRIMSSYSRIEALILVSDKKRRLGFDWNSTSENLEHRSLILVQEMVYLESTFFFFFDWVC